MQPVSIAQRSIILKCYVARIETVSDCWVADVCHVAPDLVLPARDLGSQHSTTRRRGMQAKECTGIESKRITTGS